MLMFVACWTLFMFDPTISHEVAEVLSNGTVSHEGIANFISSIIERHLGSTSTTLFFLMGAMTIVEVVDQNGGFDWVKGVMNTRSKRKLLWRIAFLTFCPLCGS